MHVLGVTGRQRWNWGLPRKRHGLARKRTLALGLALVLHVVCGLAFLLLLLVCSPLAGAQGRPVPDGASSWQETVTLRGNTPLWAQPGRVVGVVAPEVRLERMVLVLKADPAREQALRLRVQQQHEPGSAQYHRWLTAAEFGREFGVTPGQLATVTGWLASRGFRVEPVSAGRRLVIFSGSEAAVEDAFHVSLQRYAVAGSTRVANSQDPQIPQALAGLVRGVLSLHDLPRQSQIARQEPIALPATDGAGGGRVPRLHPLYSEGTTHYLFPADFATIYDADPLYAQGINGAGQSIAVVGRSDIAPADLTEFRSFANLGSGANVAVTVDGPDPGFVPGDQTEATLDVEWAGALAPAAQIQYVEAASTTTTDGVDLAAAYVVNHRLASVLSVSYASCEQSMGATELAFYDDLWTQAASEGISVFASSGDAGAAGCDAGSSTTGSGRAVSGMCTPVWVTCVGGTEFEEGDHTYWNPYNGPGSESALGYIPEVVWNESGANGGSGLWAGGGGVSTVYAQPPWQAAVAGSSGNGMRTVPDVAVSTAEHDGYLGCVSGSWYVFSGTSLSAPAWAAMMAMINQSQSAQGMGSAQGSANPELYALLEAPSPPFHGTLAGNNSVPGVNGFTASGSFNLATGLGSVDVAALVNSWAFNATGLAESFTLTATPDALTVVAGNATRFAIVAATTSGSTGPITLAASAPAGVAVSIAPTTIQPGGQAQVQVQTAPNAQSGTIVVTGSSGASQQTLRVPLTVAPAPTLSVASAPTALVVTAGASAGATITVSSGGSFAGTASLTVSGLPTGVNAVWNRTVLAPPGSATLTLVAEANAPPVQAAPAVVTATGDGLSATTTVMVTVLAAQSELSIAAGSTALRLVAGSQLSLPVTVTAATGFVGRVRVGVAGLPGGVTATWSASSFAAIGPATQSLTLTLHATPTAATAANQPLTLTAFGDGQTAYGAASLSVALPTAIELELSANPLSMTPGSSLPVTATVRVVGPLTLAADLSDVALRMSGLPAGVTASWGTIGRNAAGLLMAQGVVTAAATATPGTTRSLALAEVTDRTTGLVYDGVEPVSVIVHPQATLTVAVPAGTLLLVPGMTASITVTATGLPLTALHPALLHLPAGVTAGWTASGSGWVLRLAVASSARPANGAMEVVVSGLGLTASSTLAYRLY